MRDGKECIVIAASNAFINHLGNSIVLAYNLPFSLILQYLHDIPCLPPSLGRLTRLCFVLCALCFVLCALCFVLCVHF